MNNLLLFHFISDDKLWRDYWQSEVSVRHTGRSTWHRISLSTHERVQAWLHYNSWILGTNDYLHNCSASIQDGGKQKIKHPFNEFSIIGYNIIQQFE